MESVERGLGVDRRKSVAGDEITLHTGESAEVRYIFQSYKFAGDVVAEVEGERRLVLAGEYERSEGSEG